jgi:hypothetical protein
MKARESEDLNRNWRGGRRTARKEEFRVSLRT